MPTLRISGSWEDGTTLAQSLRVPVYTADTLQGWAVSSDRLVAPVAPVTGPTGVTGPGLLIPSAKPSSTHRIESGPIALAPGPVVLTLAAQSRGYTQLAIQAGGSAASTLGVPVHSWTARAELAVLDLQAGSVVRSAAGVQADVRLAGGWATVTLQLTAQAAGSVTLCPSVRSAAAPDTDGYGFAGDGSSGVAVACISINTAPGRYITGPETDAAVGPLQTDRTYQVPLGHPLMPGATLTCPDPPPGYRLDGSAGAWRFVPIQQALTECPRFVVAFPARVFDTALPPRVFEVTL